MKFVCQTLFDITATGITGHCKLGRMPFQDTTGQVIADEQLWNRARNQQRNWETITQILSLRTQLFNLSEPVQDQTGTRWMFKFETETAGVYGPDDDPVQVLRDDATGVPMLLNLNNNNEIAPVLITHGSQQNIWFSPESINN
jgi:hypothetical protein